MNYQEWEFFEEAVGSKRFSTVDAGPLFGPISSFSIKRDKHLQLVLTSISAGNSQRTKDNLKANAVEIIDGEVLFRDRCSDAVVVARGVLPGGYKVNYTEESGPSPSGGIKEQNSTISALHWTRQDPKSTVYIMDWVENLSGNFLWPHLDQITETPVKERRLSVGEDEVIIRSENPSTSSSASCARLVIGDLIVIIGTSRAKRDNIKNPGFILYLGDPDEETRMKVRSCLSFLLGDYLVHLGWTCYDSKWEPVSFCAISGQALVEEAARISGRPPAPLGMKYLREIDPAMLSRMATGLFGIYEGYELRTTFWNYWHAKAAPTHMSAAHFGSAIEALQRAYFKKNGADGRSRIVNDKVTWQALSQQITKCIADSELAMEEKRLLTNKVQQLNSAPQSVAAERFFNALALQVGLLETQAWKNRNRAAHGEKVTTDRGVQLIRENKVLMMLMHRILLTLSGAGDLYYDYYTLDPTQPRSRHLTQALPEENAPAK